MDLNMSGDPGPEIHRGLGSPARALRPAGPVYDIWSLHLNTPFPRDPVVPSHKVLGPTKPTLQCLLLRRYLDP